MIGRVAQLWRRSRGRVGSESGLSVAELSIAVSLLVIVGASIGTTLTSSFQATSSLDRQSRGLDEVRVAVARLEREFRSAECVFEPLVSGSGATASGTRLRFETRVDGGSYEVLYRVENGTLYRTEGAAETVIATEILSSPAPFTLTANTRRSLDVLLTAQPGGKETQVIETSIAGRNAWRDC